MGPNAGRSAGRLSFRRRRARVAGRPRRARVIGTGVAIACLPAVAGCGGQPGTTPDDRHRVAVMAAEPVFAKLSQPPYQRPGFLSGPRQPPGLVRGSVSGDLVSSSARAETSTGPAPLSVGVEDKRAARADAASLIGVLRNTGWTIYFVGCTPPRAPNSSPTGPTGIWPIAEPGTWVFTAFGFKVVDGVSYAVDVGAAADSTGFVGASVTMRAPNGHERITDLFPDRPAAVALAVSCIEWSADPTQLIAAGPVLHVGDYAPEERAGPSPSNPRSQDDVTPVER